MAQNENGEETQKSEHARACVIVSSSIVLSLSEADGGRCGREVLLHQKVPAAPARTPYHTFSDKRHATMNVFLLECRERSRARGPNTLRYPRLTLVPAVTPNACTCACMNRHFATALTILHHPRRATQRTTEVDVSSHL